MKKNCALHPENEATALCSKCKKGICGDCFSVSGTICPDCACQRDSAEYAQTKKAIKKASLQRMILLLFLVLAITGLFLLIPIAPMRPYFFVFIILPGLPVIPFSAPSAFRGIKTMLKFTDGGFTKFLVAYLLIALYAAAMLIFGIISNFVYVIMRTMSISLNKGLNKLLLRDYMDENRYSPPETDYLYLK